MSYLNVLRTYAQTRPSKLPPSILFSHTPTSLTIYDCYPKSIFHFLILPLPRDNVTLDDLDSLKTLLRGDKTRAEEVLTGLKEDAQALKKEIQDEMLSRYGFSWPIWTGFHATPSMTHLHLHVLSNDLCSEKLKNKKHYNSFHPKLGFFLDLNEVLSWFDAEPSYYSSMAKLDPKQYEPILKQDMSCWHCGTPFKNIPKLKAHLQEEWDSQAKQEKAKLDRKRLLEEKEKKRTSDH